MSQRGSSGFTLLEVMIALVIMAVLSLLSAQALKSAIGNKSLVNVELSRDARLADTLKIIRADVAAAFHHRDVFCKMSNDLLATPTPAPPQQGVPGQPPQAAPPPSFPPQQAGPAATPRPCPPEVTGFIGGPDSLFLTTLSNVRVIRDSQEGDQAKIGFYLKSCRSLSANAAPGAKSISSQCLYRSVSPYLDGEVDKPGLETVLAENVQEFKLRYLGPEHQDYVDTWRTGRNGNDVTRDKFPYAVEISLTLLDKNDPKDKPSSASILAPLAFENNPKKKEQPKKQAGP